MTFQHTIMGDKWTIVVDKKLPPICDGEDQGVTLPFTKTVVLKKKGLSLSTIIHELTHAYHKYQCLDAVTEVTNDDREEIMAEFVSLYSVRILNDAITILSRIINKQETPIVPEDRGLLQDFLKLEQSLEAMMERLRGE